MGWIESISEALIFIEENITEDISIADAARKAAVSPFYFQKGFSMLCGFTVGEYIRMRRLALAGSDVAFSEEKIIDIAMKYGYESPDSFTKAFTRFHGATPSAVRKEGAAVKSFAPLRIKFSLEGGYIMDYKIMAKDEFTVSCVSKKLSYEEGREKVPVMWSEHFSTGRGQHICGMYGINIDEEMGGETFEYLIADNYIPAKNMPQWVETRVIPKHTWAVFPCRGGMPVALAELQRRIFTEWLPNQKDYEIAAGYNIEVYTDVKDYPKGNRDENYYCEVWIPVKKK